jgi:hypothetical protein
VGPARMIAESLTPKPGIREHNRHEADLARRLPICPLLAREADMPRPPERIEVAIDPNRTLAASVSGLRVVKMLGYPLSDPRQTDIL